MADVDIKVRCPRCLGTGSDDNNRDSEGNPIVESCIPCNGVGYVAKDKVDTTDIMAELDYIHGKVTAIWNKIK